MDSKNCLACDKKLIGRTDKKFCDDYCRNNYNNKLNSDSTNLIRNINNTLRKNRRVLEGILDQKETAKCTRQKLLDLGYSFSYHTHTVTTKQGNIYYFCYEFGMMHTGDDWYLVVTRKN
jgi:hypothetical protein